MFPTKDEVLKIIMLDKNMTDIALMKPFFEEGRNACACRVFYVAL